MKIVRLGLLALCLPLLLAASPPAKMPAKAKPAAKTQAATPVSAAKTPVRKGQQKTEASAAPSGDAPKTYPLQTLTFPGGVTMTEMVYDTQIGFRPLTLDLYQPAGKSFPRPGLVFVHGGSWNSGDSRHSGTFGDFPGLLASIAARGIVVASINYRLSGEAHFPAPLHDVKNAISWLRGHATEFNLDQTRIAIWGESAGGQLAALAGVSCGVAALEPPNPAPGRPSDCVEAVIDWYGIVDFESMEDDLGKPAPDKSFEGDYLGCEPALCPVEVAHNASPLAYISAMSPPFLIQHGADDITVSPKQSQKLYDALRDKNVPAELQIYPGVSHGFARADGSADPGVNKAAVEKLETFLDATFPKKPASSPYKPPRQQGLPY